MTHGHNDKTTQQSPILSTTLSGTTWNSQDNHRQTSNWRKHCMAWTKQNLRKQQATAMRQQIHETWMMTMTPHTDVH